MSVKDFNVSGEELKNAHEEFVFASEEMSKINGFATFNNPAPGVVAVKVSSINHTTINLLVDLAFANDSSYGTGNIVNASSMVVLFPLSGDGTATVVGHLYADTDLNDPCLEDAPQDIKVSATIDPLQLIDFVNHTGCGRIVSLACEDAVSVGYSDSNSNYSITVPATASGLKLIIKADDFIITQTIEDSSEVQIIYYSTPDTVTVTSGSTFNNIIIYDS